MEIETVYLNEQVIPLEEAKKYIIDHFTLEAFMGGAEIQTPDGVLRADVRLSSNI